MQKDKGSVSCAVDQYRAYIAILNDHKNDVVSERNEYMKIAEIEMAVFQWAIENNKTSNKENPVDTKKRRG